MKKIDIRVQKTYQQLVNAMIELLTEKELDNLSVSEICEKAGVHRATFYKHFNDKSEFINYCFVNQLSNISLDELIKNPTPENIRSGIKYVVEELFRFVDKNMVLLSVVCSEKYHMTLGSSFLNALSSFCNEKLISVLPTTSQKAEIFSNFYSSALIGVIRWYVVNADDCSKDDIFYFLEHRIDELVGFYENNIYLG